MIHKNILKKFIEIFPQYEATIELWFPSGKNRIRVRLIDRREFIFTYNSESDWCLETVDSFIKHM